MAITAYVGLPGSGKSYSVTENVIVPGLKAGRTIYTNIPFNEKVKELGGQLIQFDNKDLKDDHNFVKSFAAGAIIVIDELWRIFPSGMTTKQIAEPYREFMAEHRHNVDEDGNSTDIVFVTQDLSQIAAFCRNLIETTYKTVKMEKLGAKNKFRVDVYSGAPTGQNIPASQREKQLFGKYKPEVYQYYKSHTKSTTGIAGLEEKTDTRFKIFSKGKVFAFLAVLVVLFGMGINGALNFFNPETVQQTDVIETPSPQTQAQPQQQAQFTKVVDTVEKRLFDAISHFTYENLYYENGKRFVSLGFLMVYNDRESIVDDKFIYSNGMSLVRLSDCLWKLSLDNLSKLISCPKKETPEEQGIYDVTTIFGKSE